MTARLVPALVVGLVSLAPAVGAPVREGDPLTLGSKWKGTLSQKGQISGVETPLALTAVVTVTKRDGAEFEAELYEEGAGNSGIRLTYLVRGTISPARNGRGFQVDFKSYASKDAQSQTFLNIPYRGTLTGKTWKGTWKFPKNDDGTTIEGDFSLERGP